MSIFSNTKVASTEATQKCTENFKPEVFKQAVLNVVRRDGLTFEQQNFLGKVHDECIKLEFPDFRS